MQIKILLFLFLCSDLISNNAYGWWWKNSKSKAVQASSIGVVNKVKGNVFIVNKNKMRKLRKGDKIYRNTEVITEENALISFSDFYDHKFHLSGSGHIKLFGKIIELKRGYLWVQSYKKKGDFVVRTANAQIVYNYGEFIFSFNDRTGKSQILTIGGRMAFNNPNQSYEKIMVDEGQFSFVHDSYGHGTPRGATYIGQKSFQKILSLFGSIRPMRTTYYSPQSKRKNKQGRSGKRKREIASVGQTQARDERLKKNLIILKNRLKNSGKSVMQIYREKLTQIKKKLSLTSKKRKYRGNTSRSMSHNIKRDGVKINIFRSAHKSTYRPVYNKSIYNNSIQRRESSSFTPPVIQSSAVERLKPRKRQRARAVASLPPVKKTPSKELKSFEQSLKKAYGKQPRHKDEVNKLIMELDNYKKNYQVDY